MHSVRNKKSQVKSFIHKYAHRYNGECDPIPCDGSVPSAVAPIPIPTMPPPPSSTGFSPADYSSINNTTNNNTFNNPSNNTPENTVIDSNPSFSEHYERYMRTREMNMQHIQALENASGYPIPPPNNNGISPLERELLELADPGNPYAAYSYAQYPPYAPPPPMPAYYSGPPYAYEYAAPDGQFPQQYYAPVPVPAYQQPLSPYTELDRFRASFAAPSPYTTTTTTYTAAYPPWQYPQEPPSYPSYYEDMHQPPPSIPATATEIPPNSWPYFSAATAPPPLEKDQSQSQQIPPSSAPVSLQKLTPPSNPLSLQKPIPPSNPVSLQKIAPPTKYDPTTTPSVSKALRSDSRTLHSGLSSIPENKELSSNAQPPLQNRTQQLQQDLDKLLVNVQEQHKYRSSSVPKAPPPSPDDYAPQQRSDETVVFADMDFTQPDTSSNHTLSPMGFHLRRSGQLSPSSLSPFSSRSQSPASFQSSTQSSAQTSQSTTPSHSSPASPVQPHSCAAPSDNELSSFPSTTTVTSTDVPIYRTTSPSTSTVSLPLPPPSISVAPPPNPSLPPIASLPVLPPPPVDQVDCQGNLPSLPPPPVLSQFDLSQLAPPRIPPPNFDYSAYDFQGNLLAPQPPPPPPPFLPNAAPPALHVPDSVSTNNISTAAITPTTTTTTTTRTTTTRTTTTIPESRSKLLDEIRTGKALRKTPTSQTTPLPTPPPANTVGAVLENAMKSRRLHIYSDDECDDEDDDEGAW